MKESKIVIVERSSLGDLSVVGRDDVHINVEAFIENYILLKYGFSKETLEKRAKKYTDLMSEEYFRRELNHILEQENSVKSKSLSQAVEIKTIKKISKGSFETLLNITQFQGAKVEERDLKLRLDIVSVNRSLKNVWGLEVENEIEITQ